MSNKGHSDPGLFGGMNHYDEHGKKIGHSDPGLFGGYNTYDEHGKKIGHSDPGLFGGMNHYDNNGKKIGHSASGLFGGMDHYDSNGKKIGHSDPGMLGGYSHNDASGGCYIATCVYGSYDCPQVWILRRYRDYKLSMTAAGRLFIKAYYKISPTLVKWFGDKKWFRKLWKYLLDKKTVRLKDKGYSDQAYEDR